ARTMPRVVGDTLTAVQKPKYASAETMIEASVAHLAGRKVRATKKKKITATSEQTDTSTNIALVSRPAISARCVMRICKAGNALDARAEKSTRPVSMIV